MNYEIVTKNLPNCIAYYKEGVINKFDDLVDFVVKSSDDCLKVNPNIECLKPDYCYVNYLDGEHRDKNIKIRYVQAVNVRGIESDGIKFMELQPVLALCVYHNGSYRELSKAYQFIMKYIDENNYEIIDYPRECYIDGIWNRDNEDDWLTEIQVPIRKK